MPRWATMEHCTVVDPITARTEWCKLPEWDNGLVFTCPKCQSKWTAVRGENAWMMYCGFHNPYGKAEQLWVNGYQDSL